MVVLDLKTEVEEGKSTKMRVKWGQCGGKKEAIISTRPLHFWRAHG